MRMKKDREKPRYRIIYNELKAQILNGTFPIGQRLPFERELCDLYGVQRITVRKSLELLVQDGLIDKQPGKGSFVRDYNEKSNNPVSNSKVLLFLMRKNQNDIQSNSSAFNAQLFFPMETICTDYGFSLLYLGLRQGTDYQALLKEHNPAGVFLVCTLPEVAYNTMNNAGLPAICINHRDERFFSILPDNDNGIRTAMNCLFEKGHKRIAYIGGIEESINAGERYNAFRLSMLEKGLIVPDDCVMHGEWTFESGYNEMDKLLTFHSYETRPSAVIAASDMMAIGCMDAIKKHGLSVPQDISVIGFDNIDMCQICTPQLTSVGTDTKQMAETAFQLMYNLINEEVETHCKYSIRLSVPLFFRESVESPPVPIMT